MEIKNWFKTSPVSASSATNVSLYRSIDVNSMVPSGTLESIDVAKVIKGNYFTAAGYPLNPKRESFALSSSDGRMKVRYFFNFDPIQKRSESSASFMIKLVAYGLSQERPERLDALIYGISLLSIT